MPVVWLNFFRIDIFFLQILFIVFFNTIEDHNPFMFTMGKIIIWLGIVLLICYDRKIY